METTREPAAAGPSGTDAAPEEAPPVDVRLLAERVYRLMRDDVRLERVRGADRLFRG